jgi:cyanophycin synthetase
MELVEIRDLDGPNLFRLAPAIKLEVCVSVDEQLSPAHLDVVAAALALRVSPEPLAALRELIVALHARCGLPDPVVEARALDLPGHHAVHYEWMWRETALALARAAFELAVGARDTDPTAELLAALERDRADDDRPIWVRDNERRVPTVGVTGTNGKTTTTRLLAHIVRRAGRHVGWCSSSGVYIDGEQVMEGDYTGPSGARRVLHDPGVEVAVLETARGGLLLRGAAYESNDVGVFLNISADHLSLQGVETLETLAEVKSVVVRVTRPEGLVVLNADDPLVLAQQAHVRAPVLLFSQDAGSAAIRAHLAAGGHALVRDGDQLTLSRGVERTALVTLAEAPMTFNGAARHMVENALAAAGAAIGLGYSPEEIADGLRSFRSDLRFNTGRLNVFKLDGRTIVVDYAHNESGLEALLDFVDALTPDAPVLALIGTAGDRLDDVFVNLGRIAGRRAARVYIKRNPKYLRERPADEPVALMEAGLDLAGAAGKQAGVYDGELAALEAALADSQPGDAIVIMCVEEQLAVFRELRDRFAEEWQ